MLGTCSSDSRFRLARAAATATRMERTRGNDAQWLVRNENVYQNEALTIPHYYPPADEMNMMLDVSLELSLFV
jgi:hypothetical protein